MLVPFSHHRRRTGQLIPAAISAQQTSTLICPWALATPCSTITITTLVTSHLIWDLIRTTLETRPTGLNRTRQNENEMIFYCEKAEIKSNLYRYCISIISLSFYVCVCTFLHTGLMIEGGHRLHHPPPSSAKETPPIAVCAPLKEAGAGFFSVCVVFLFFSHSFFFHLFFYPPSPFSFFFFSTFLVNSEEKPSHSSTVKSDASH